MKRHGNTIEAISGTSKRGNLIIIVEGICRFIFVVKKMASAVTTAKLM